LKVSIITVCLNADKTLADTLASVALQDYAQLEHLIIDGGSTDCSLALAEAWASPKLKVWSERDKGIYDAMNKGLARAKGDIVCFLNADDFFLRPDAVRVAAEAASRSVVDCIFGGTQFFEPDGRHSLRRLYSARGFRRWWLSVGMMPPHPSAFIRREAMLTAGGFDDSFRIAGDFDLIARLILRQQATWKTMPQVLTGFRQGGLSTRGREARRAIERELAVSLARLGHACPRLAVKARLPLKLAQFANLRRHQPELFFRGHRV